MFLVIAASASAALMSCVTQQAVALGQGNQEPAADVIQAADGQCAREWVRVVQYTQIGSLGAARTGGAIQRMIQQQQEQELATIKGQVYSAAFQALTQARGARP